jgi:hypothetical protein
VIFDYIQFKSIYVADNNELFGTFIVEEAQETVWSCDGNKSLRPDMFNLKSLDIVAYLNDFHHHAKPPKSSVCFFCGPNSKLK